MTEAHRILLADSRSVVAHATANLRSAEDQLRADVRAAHTAGVPITTIAKLAGVTRQTVYRWVRAS